MNFTKFFREKFNRKNATPSKVLDSYEGSEDLFISIRRAYIVAAALSSFFFGMTKLNDKPTIHKFPDNITHDSKENKKYFDNVFGKFVGRMVLQKVHDESYDGDDYVMNYGMCVFLFVLMQMKDTATETDGN